MRLDQPVAFTQERGLQPGKTHVAPRPVEQRAGEIGLLRSVGYRLRAIRSRLLVEGLALAAIGAVLGVAAGVAVGLAAGVGVGGGLSVAAGVQATANNKVETSRTTDNLLIMALPPRVRYSFLPFTPGY